MFRSLLKREQGTSGSATGITVVASKSLPRDDSRDDTPTTLSSSEIEELLRLRRENLQLRQELADANLRIRQLEERKPRRHLISSSSTIDTDDDDSNFSVEVLSLPSATSSTTTIPTGSFAANESRLRQEQREAVAVRKQKKKRNSIPRGGMSFRKMQNRRMSLPFQTIPELGQGHSSDSSITEGDESTSSLEGLRSYHHYNAKSLLLIPDLRRENSTISETTTEESVSSLEGFMRSHEHEYNPMATTKKSLLPPLPKTITGRESFDSNPSDEVDQPLCEI